MSIAQASTSHSILLDKIYSSQRLIYDFTRKFFLLGRDSLLKEMAIQPGDIVFEVGCGTARNLIALAKMHPEARFYGIDASKEMLKTANQSIIRAGLTQRIKVGFGFAESYDPKAIFGLEEPIDVAFFSYSLSMMPTWDRALEHNLELLCPQRTLYIVDFWDQRGLPTLFRKALSGWLALFHVKHEPKLIEELNLLEEKHPSCLSLRPFGRHYAFLAKIRKPNGGKKLNALAV